MSFIEALENAAESAVEKWNDPEPGEAPAEEASVQAPNPEPATATAPTPEPVKPDEPSSPAEDSAPEPAVDATPAPAPAESPDADLDAEIARLEAEHRKAQRRPADHPPPRPDPKPTRPEPVDEVETFAGIDVDAMTRVERALYEQNKKLSEQLASASKTFGAIQQERQIAEEKRAIEAFVDDAKSHLKRYPDVFGGEDFLGKTAEREFVRQVLYESDESPPLVAARLAKEYRQARRDLRAEYVQGKLRQQSQKSPRSASVAATRTPGKAKSLTAADWKSDVLLERVLGRL